VRCGHVRETALRGRFGRRLRVLFFLTCQGLFNYIRLKTLYDGHVMGRGGYGGGCRKCTGGV
jgi:hypothetical protein